jgi:cytochrome c oxidase subunit 2
MANANPKKSGSMTNAVLVVIIGLVLIVGAIGAVLKYSGGETTTTTPTGIPSLGDPVAGRQVAMRPDVNCVFCHSDDGTMKMAPSFKGLWGSVIKYDDGSTVLLDDKALRWTLKHPNDKIVDGFEPKMPNDIDTKLSETDRVNLSAYLESIGKGK